MSNDNATLRACRDALAAMEKAEAALENIPCDQCGGGGGYSDYDMQEDEEGHLEPYQVHVPCQGCGGQGSVPSWTCQGSEAALQALFATLDAAPGTLRGWRTLLDMCEAAMLTEDHVDYLKLCEEREGHLSVERTRHDFALAILAALADAMGVTGGGK